ncbi:MAG: DNA-directed RNA polymerase subunit RpoH/Rpb5 C-terminal domain-containing protein, partial [Candidatus Micrarchaeota archaeon]
MIDPTKCLTHFLVPKHEILSEDEMQKVLASFRVTKEQLPKIPADDPVIKAIN